MKNRAIFGLLLFAVLAFCLPAPAIVVSDYAIATNAPTGVWDVNWDYVYRYKGSSAVAVGPNWLLTAAHVADDTASSTVVVNGTNYYQQEIIFHSASADPENVNKADLALVRFDKEFPGYYPLYATETFPTQTSKRLNAVMIGYGTTGTVYSTYYMPKAWNAVPNGSGVRRWGTQKIDGGRTLAYDGGGAIGVSTNVGFEMYFSVGDSAYEAGAGTYDSGGGTFVNDGGTWKLAGINTLIYHMITTVPNASDWMFSVSVPAYDLWITQTMDAITGDADADGIPNWWEAQYLTNVLSSVDQDGDGVIGTDEYIADTDPTDSNALWQVGGSFALTNQTFTFVGSTARQYQLFYTTNDLTDAGLTWTPHGSPIWGAGAGTSIAVTNTDDTVFYRVWVTLP
ncbi:MAG: trypsin-like serine protease [Planctomycetes bacterium]|nr:trypsin-like serine protease [Planctomycetota bacterium]MBI9021266.1 trypsin-like serine protease [Verrucomicrobiota bacterium]